MPSMKMEVGKYGGTSAGYQHGPPWVFRGSALYQLHLVKAATARAFVPKEQRLAGWWRRSGYALGGMFLARYDDSPAGKFDELVVIAGIVWNLPTSCAWVARVLVNSVEACQHGRKEVGLPSHVATFSQAFVQHLSAAHSGQTKDHPDLLKYSCQVPCRVRPVRPARIWCSRTAESQEGSDGKIGSTTSDVLAESDAQNESILVLLSRPILTLEFNSLLMHVDAPKIVVPHSKKKEVRYSST